LIILPIFKAQSLKFLSCFLPLLWLIAAGLVFKHIYLIFISFFSGVTFYYLANSLVQFLNKLNLVFYLAFSGVNFVYLANFPGWVF
jgi:hypothetical protein